jgi:hypothetical protein
MRLFWAHSFVPYFKIYCKIDKLGAWMHARVFLRSDVESKLRP